MIQSVEILQMNSQELKEYMEKLAMENPVVDLEEARPAEEKEDFLKKIEWLSASDECNRTYHSYDYSDSENDWMSNIGKEEEETLESVLLLQLIGGAWSKRTWRFSNISPNAWTKTAITPHPCPSWPSASA